MTKLKYYITHPYENFYKSISLGWLIQTSVYIFLSLEILSTLTHTDFSTSPLFWHSAGDHHLWDLIALLLFYQIQVRYFKQTPFLSLLNLLFLTYINEVYWYYTFVISHIYYNEFFNPAWVLSLQQLSFAIFILFMLYVYRKLQRFPTFYLLSLPIIYILWFSQGFHVTIDYQGYTPFYFDIQTNLIEMGHWFIAIILWTIQLYLLRFKFLKIKMNSSEQKSEIISSLIMYNPQTSDSLYTLYINLFHWKHRSPI